MSLKKKKLPVGVENFETLIKEEFYYVDKTEMIAELLRNPAQVNLFTRPRRFGKSLNMSMLKCFFETGGDSSVFDGLAISKEKELCEKYMGKFPVISISLKGIDAGDFDMAGKMSAMTIYMEASRFRFLLDSERLDQEDKLEFAKLLNSRMDLLSVRSSLWLLSRLLKKHYGQKVILLIDEYDVPLQKAFYNHYYEDMVQLLRGMFGQVLKTNDNLAFAVLTGCLRVSKESIFTGMNNLKVFSIMDTSFDEYFGFTDTEVRELMDYYELTDSYSQAKEWYNGYRFGESDVYCPWDVINYCYDLRANPKARPENYWANSSGNDAVSEFVRRLDVSVASRELERLTAGETVRKEIFPELTYREMYSSIENLWSLLYMTGYLTKRGEPEDRMIPLCIPNMEIRDIFKRQIMELFKEQVSRDGTAMREFCDALKAGDAPKTEELFGKYLKKTVGIRDTFVRRNLKENFYHGILLGILSFKGNWYVTSNYETGDGYGDILIETEDDETGIIIEVKYAHDGDLEKGVAQALRQIEERHYDETLFQDGIEKVLKYGFACYKKKCRVALAKAR